MTRTIVREAFEFPFQVAGCVAVLALVDSTNEAALRFDAHLGFREVMRVPDGGLEGDLVVLQMLRSECKWLRPH
jgi:RimJ/RimL family protein N-acetyltransferase